MENEIIGLILMVVGGVLIYFGGFLKDEKENTEHSFSDYVLLVVGLLLEVIAGFLLPTIGVD